MKPYLYALILSAVGAVAKVGLIEGGFALNFLSFTYHGLFSTSDGWLIASGIVLSLAVNFAFYFILAAMLIHYYFSSKSTAVYFVVGLVISFFELATYNLPDQRIEDLSTVVSLTAVNIVLMYFVLASIGEKRWSR